MKVKSFTMEINGRRYYRHHDGTWMAYAYDGNMQAVDSRYAVEALTEVARFRGIIRAR